MFDERDPRALQLVKAVRTSPKRPLAFRGMIMTIFVVGTLEVSLADFLSGIEFRFHNDITFKGFSFKSADG